MERGRGEQDRTQHTHACRHDNTTERRKATTDVQLYASVLVRMSVAIARGDPGDVAGAGEPSFEQIAGYTSTNLSTGRDRTNLEQTLDLGTEINRESEIIRKNLLEQPIAISRIERRHS